MASTYRALMQTRAGGPEFLKIVELPIEPPGPGQIRIRVQASGVGATDLMVLRGNYRFAPKVPVVPGYEAAGVVDAIGPGVTGFEIGQRVASLTVYGAFAEMLTREAAHFLPIPDGVSDAEAAAVILNYGTAWQMIHRSTQVRVGQAALVTGAGGGVGTAALELLRLAGVKTYGAASPGKHATVRALGAIPIDYAAVPTIERVDHAFDAIGGASVNACLTALKPRGTLVAFGFMAATTLPSQIAMFANLLIGSRLRGRVGKFYGITMQYRKDPKPLHEDLARIFALMEEKKIAPLIARRFGLLEGRGALELLAAGKVEGKLVLVR